MNTNDLNKAAKPTLSLFSKVVGGINILTNVAVAFYVILSVITATYPDLLKIITSPVHDNVPLALALSVYYSLVTCVVWIFLNKAYTSAKRLKDDHED